MNAKYKISTNFSPCRDQKKAIEYLSEGILAGARHQTLLGVTGSGKTFTMAKVIENCNRPALVVAHNKTLAAQLYKEFRRFFPENAVHYFVSYYDYYQPEAYIPTSDTYIEKDSAINDELDKLRHAATRALLERRDTIIVASVSCIYGIGSPEEYSGMLIKFFPGQQISRKRVLERLIEMQYSRNDIALVRGKFRVRGDTVEVFGAGDEYALRIELFGDEIDSLSWIDPLRGLQIRKLDQAALFPASHYVTTPGRMHLILEAIRKELQLRIREFEQSGKLLERQRLLERTEFDLEMLELVGYCSGIENYSRHLTGRAPGEAPPTLIDYLPDDSIIFVDESHVTVPQIQGMYRGDFSRKRTLVDYGFRLPSALDNRPLKFEEFNAIAPSLIYVSATPSAYEYRMSDNRIVEQITRPTGLIDPLIIVRPSHGQVDDLYGEIRIRAEKQERVLVTTLTKKMAEDLTDYYIDLGLKVAYLHSEIDTLERVKIIRELRSGKYDAIIGVNLLREGLDLPEVSLVAILDADQEGFLRSTTSLVQTIGRCARNIMGIAILYAERITRSMQQAIDETNRRREIQSQYNHEMGIIPESVQKDIDSDLFLIAAADYMEIPATKSEDPTTWSLEEFEAKIIELEEQMREYASELHFEQAAEIRDMIWHLQKAFSRTSHKK